MSNLKLVTTENFGNLECNFYRNMNDDILLTREQIGQALEYMDPAKAIQKIHLKHKDRLEGLCLRFSEIRHPPERWCRCKCGNCLLYPTRNYGNL